ncbi:MAG: peptidylprolyl isomerase [Sporanaerobacter sp.]|jgi:peptidyl-prolyl cis-trans isomerase C|uniref:peptidylprolyl isomerase n=1 Tax=Sporanaerobacter sp. TaxID=2010183 RepID=UPI003A1009E8
MNENPILATVNGKEITQKDVYVFLNELGPQVAMQFQSPDGMKRVVDELINQELLYFDAIENGFDEEETYKLALEKVKENVLKQYAFNKIISGIFVTEEEINEYYNEHKMNFQTPESVRASHILVKEEDEAKKIQKEINEGLSFEEAAKKYSTCPSKENGGDLGEFTKGQMVKEFEDAAFSIEEGKLSEPVKTQFGYHLIKVQYKKEAEMRSLEEVKNQINEQMIMLKQQEKYLDKTQELRSKYEVKMNI